MSLSDMESLAILNFRKYLRIPSVHPDVNYDECVSFLTNLGRNLGLTVNVYSPTPGKPIVVMTLLGSDPKLPSLLLNSHMDVVPVHKMYWKHDPFGAEMDADGNIFGRGAQDMKCVGIQYIEAIRRCIKSGWKFKRTVHLSFVPDEEIGGIEGMCKFVKTEEFKKLNVGCALDESMPSISEEFVLCYAERSTWDFEIECTGQSGHGSLLPNNLAADKFQYVINKFLDFREHEKKRLLENPNLTIGEVTTVNLMCVEGGNPGNVIPSKLTVHFQLRVAIDVNPDQLKNTIDKWCKEAGNDVRLLYDEITTPIRKNNDVTKLDDSNFWWLSFKDACDKMNLKVKPVVCPGGTDSQYLRQIGIPAFGFSPMNYTPILLHDHDEFLNKKIFLKGIEIYQNIIFNLANV